MDILLYPLFVSRLALTLFSEFLFIVLRLSIGTKTFFLSFIFSLILIGSASSQIGTKRAPTEPPIIYQKDRQAAETRISFWESLAATTPNRDSFLNLEKLYRYLEEEQEAQLFRRRAFSLDPNNDIFKNDLAIQDIELQSSTSAIINSELPAPQIR